MITFIILCVQIIFIEYAFSQVMNPPAGMNNGVPNSFGPGQNIGLPNQGLPTQMMANNMQGNQYGPMGPQYSPSVGQMGISNGFSPNTGFSPLYGGNGNGDVTVVGELPVAGTTAVTGHVPLTGKVQFTGSIPAGGIVTISGQCGCGCNGQSAPYGAKTSFNNKPYY